jgi:hypothetical protein
MQLPLDCSLLMKTFILCIIDAVSRRFLGVTDKQINDCCVVYNVLASRFANKKETH